MNAKTGIPLALVLTLLAAGASRAQSTMAGTGTLGSDAYQPYEYTGPMQRIPELGDDQKPLPEPMQHTDSWINYCHDGSCNGPIGDNGPIKEELFLWTGPSLPVGGGIFRRTLEMGWDVEGGGRTLIFNPDCNADWNVDLSLANLYNHGNRPGTTFPLFSDNPIPTSILSLNRTYVSAGFGREAYFDSQLRRRHIVWRFGVDGGTRLGSEKVDLNDLTAAGPPEAIFRQSKIFGGVYLDLHAEFEIPCGHCVLLGGVRSQWDYDWCSVLSTNSDISDVNLLLTFGARF